MVLPVKSPCDLNLVLSVLQKTPFEPIRKILLVLLTRKVFFFGIGHLDKENLQIGRTV